MEPDGQSEADWAARLYDASAAEMLLYGRALGLGHAESQDVLHDAFRALLALETAPRQPRFYLIRTFRNRALNHRRGLWRRIFREAESKRWFEREPDETPAERAATRALATLPAEQREVIVLKVWHELTFEAIGELLGASPNTVAGRYRYGMQKLKNALNPEPKTTPTSNPRPNPHSELSPHRHEHEHPGTLGTGTSSAWIPTAPTLPEA